MNLIYDIRCDSCGQQLHFWQTKDNEGDTVIYVHPCQECARNRESDGETVNQWQVFNKGQ